MEDRYNRIEFNAGDIDPALAGKGSLHKVFAVKGRKSTIVALENLAPALRDSINLEVGALLKNRPVEDDCRDAVREVLERRADAVKIEQGQTVEAAFSKQEIEELSPLLLEAATSETATMKIENVSVKGAKGLLTVRFEGLNPQLAERLRYEMEKISLVEIKLTGAKTAVIPCLVNSIPTDPHIPIP